MKTRAITGFFFVIVMLASVLLGHYVFGVFYLLLSGFALYEFYGLIKKGGISPNQPAGIVNGLFIYIVFALISYKNDPAYHKILFLVALTLSAVFIQELYKKSDAPFTKIAYTFTGIIYAVLPFVFFHALAYIGGSFSFHIPLAFLIMLW